MVLEILKVYLLVIVTLKRHFCQNVHRQLPKFQKVQHQMSKLRHLLRQKIITQAPSIIPLDGHQQQSLLGTHASSWGNSMNTTRPTPSGTALSVAITRSDNIANDCRHEEGHNRDKTQVWLLERQ